MKLFDHYELYLRIGACIIFIFGALIEYAFVNYIGTNEELKRCELNRSEEQNGRCKMPVSDSIMLQLQ